MNPIENIELFLPKFLTPESTKDLFKELRKFPSNIDRRIYSRYYHPTHLLMGDGIADMPVVDMIEKSFSSLACVIISNTCDIAPENDRFYSPMLCYAPLLSFQKYEKVLREEFESNPEKIDIHINNLKNQLITSAFFLPKGANLSEDSVLYFDRIISYPNDSMNREELVSKRIFSFSNYGNYLFVIKLSIHFTRINDGIDRNIAPN